MKSKQSNHGKRIKLPILNIEPPPHLITLKHTQSHTKKKNPTQTIQDRQEHPPDLAKRTEYTKNRAGQK